MDPVALLNNYMTVAVAALAGGDYPTALNNALAAQGMIATLPRISRSAGQGGGQQEASWDSKGIDDFIRRLRQQQGAALGVQCQQITITEPTVIDDGSQYAESSGGYVQ